MDVKRYIQTKKRKEKEKKKKWRKHYKIKNEKNRLRSQIIFFLFILLSPYLFLTNNESDLKVKAESNPADITLIFALLSFSLDFQNKETLTAVSISFSMYNYFGYWCLVSEKEMKDFSNYFSYISIYISNGLMKNIQRLNIFSVKRTL